MDWPAVRIGLSAPAWAVLPAAPEHMHILTALLFLQLAATQPAVRLWHRLLSSRAQRRSAGVRERRCAAAGMVPRVSAAHWRRKERDRTAVRHGRAGPRSAVQRNRGRNPHCSSCASCGASAVGWAARPLGTGGWLPSAPIRRRRGVRGGWLSRLRCPPVRVALAICARSHASSLSPTDAQAQRSIARSRRAPCSARGRHGHRFHLKQRPPVCSRSRTGRI